MKPVIICGGVGTKMWPASRQSMPKHFLPLIGGKSLFEINYEDLREKFMVEEIYISTNPSQVGLIKKQKPEIPDENLIIEPEMKNTGPAIGFIAAKLFQVSPDEPFFVIQVDDIRKPKEKLFEMMDVCNRLAMETTAYITGGIKPSYAIMGIDYLLRGDRVSKEDEVGVYKVEKFLLRGSKESAEEYIKEGRVYTHSNHTCMTPRNYLKMYEKYRKDWYEPLMEIANGGEVETNFGKMIKGTQEELTQLVHNNGESLLVELPFEWIDIGTWESTDKYLKETGIHQNGENVVEVDSKDNFVQVQNGKQVAIIGFDNVVVVDTGDALLICKKDQSGRVGEVVEKLKEKGKNELL